MLQNNWTKKFLTPSRLDTFNMYVNEGKLFNMTVGRHWVDQKWEINDEPNKEDFIKQLLGISGQPDNPSISSVAGTALHSAIEEYGIDKIKNSMVELSNAINTKDNLAYDESKKWQIYCNPDAVIDVSTKDMGIIKETWLNGNILGLDVRGKVDAMTYEEIIETKSVGDKGYGDPFYGKYEKYEGSMQWKMYLLMSELDIAIYDLFSYKSHFTSRYTELFETPPDMIIITGKKLEITDHIRYRFQRYQGMEYEVAQCIRDFYEFLMDMQSDVKEMALTYNIKIKGLIE